MNRKKVTYEGQVDRRYGSAWLQANTTNDISLVLMANLEGLHKKGEIDAEHGDRVRITVEVLPAIEVDESELKPYALLNIGDVIEHGLFEWRTMQNPEGLDSDKYHAYGSTVGVPEAARLKVLAIDQGEALVPTYLVEMLDYGSDKDKSGGGAAAWVGTLFYLTGFEIIEMQQKYHDHYDAEGAGKAKVRELLAQSEVN